MPPDVDAEGNCAVSVKSDAGENPSIAMSVTDGDPLITVFDRDGRVVFATPVE